MLAMSCQNKIQAVNFTKIVFGRLQSVPGIRTGSSPKDSWARSTPVDMTATTSSTSVWGPAVGVLILWVTGLVPSPLA